VGAHPAYVEFVHLPSYVHSVKGALGDNEQRELEMTICRNPRAGAVISGTGGLRKLRLRFAGRGKSGGARVVYFYRAPAGRVYLVLFYPKNVQAELTSTQRKHMWRLTNILRTEK